jgi:flagellar protein FlaG
MQTISSVGPASAVDGPGSKDPRQPANSNASAAPTPARSAAPDPSASAATLAQLKAAVASANQQLDQSNRELTFVFDDKLGRMLVKIVDKRTNTVVRQVPSEDMLAMARALSGTQTQGALLKSKA